MMELAQNMYRISQLRHPNGNL